MFKIVKIYPNFLKNLGALFVAQGGAYFFHLATIPYITRKLGPAAYGEMSYILASVGSLLLITEWGFNYYGSKSVAVADHDIDKISELFWSITLSKLIICLICFIAMLLVISVCHVNNFSAYLIAYIAVFGAVLNPSYYYQGLRESTNFAFISLAVRVVSIYFVYKFIFGPADLDLAIAIPSLSGVIIGGLGIAALLRNKNLVVMRISGFSLKRILQKTFHLFAATATQQLFLNFIVLIVGLTTDAIQVGLFAASYFFLRVIISLQLPITQAVFPKIATALNDHVMSASILFRVLVGSFALSAILSLGFYFLSDYIVQIFYGATFRDAGDLIKILAVMPMLISVTTFFGVYMLINYGHEDRYSRIVFFSTFCSLLVTCALSFLYGSFGACIGLVIGESVSALMMSYAALKLVPTARLVVNRFFNLYMNVPNG